MSSDGGTRYRFGPRERGGALAGWRAGQIVTVAVGLLLGVTVLRWAPDALGVAVAIGVLVVCGALATVPFAGRTGDQWLPVTVYWGARHPRGRATRRERMAALRGVRLLRAGWRDMGVVHDHRSRTLTAALSVRGTNFALHGPDEQDRRVGGWSSVLASLAREGSPVHRVQWVASSFPDDGHGIRTHLAQRGEVPQTSACAASYRDLLADTAGRACTREILLAVQVRMGRSVESGCASLAREVESLARLLSDGDVEVRCVLSADDLARHLLRTYEPRPPRAGGPPPADPWPMAMDEGWSTVRVDGMVHATFWVAEWPRIDVRSDFLAPLLLTSARATLAVVMGPLGPDAAVRKVEASRTADLADARSENDHLSEERTPASSTWWLA